jgi:hypothetical protein
MRILCEAIRTAMVGINSDVELVAIDNCTSVGILLGKRADVSGILYAI